MTQPSKPLTAIVSAAVPTRSPAGTPSSSVAYQRDRDLPGLIPVWADEVRGGSCADDARLIGKLRRALRAERRRGLGGHWTYDLARHAALLAAYRAEVARLAARIDACRSRRIPTAAEDRGRAACPLPGDCRVTRTREVSGESVTPAR